MRVFAYIAPVSTGAAYSVTKGAARTLTKSMMAYLGGRFPDIVINDWIPGELKTGTCNPAGTDPALSAKWCVCLALWQDPMLNGQVFDQDMAFLEPMSLKRKVLNKIIGRKCVPLRLSSSSSH